MKSKIPAIIFAILLSAVLSARVPLLNAAPRDYCDGFQNPPVPLLNTEPFVFRSIPFSSDFIPVAIEDYDNDGDPDSPFAENLDSLNFRYRSAIDDLIQGAGYAPILRSNPQKMRASKRGAPTSPREEHYLNFHGIAAVDFDNDGLQDFIIAPYYQKGVPIMLFHNLGNWQFEFSHSDFFQNLLGFNSNSDWGSETIIIADLTGDGLNDVYIPFYTFKEPYQSVFLRNTGGGFVEEAMARGIGIPNTILEERPEGAQAVDIDDDGDLDFYVAHHLFINDGAGYFTDAREAYGLPRIFEEGIAFVDYDNDGLLDLYARSPDPAYLLFRNTETGFVNTSVPSGFACLTQNLVYYEGDAWADFDRDGDMDLLLVYDYLSPKYNLYLNQGDGTFRLGYAGSHFVNLPAIADMDFDGDLDAVALNELAENKFPKSAGVDIITVVPVDAEGKHNEQGATIHVQNYCNGQVQTRVIGTNNVFLAQGDYGAYFAVSTGCMYQISVTFMKKGTNDKQVVTIPYNPAVEGSLKVRVNRTNVIKEPYPSFRKAYFMPVISGEVASPSVPRR
ncbi:MAG: VCBS repeat-containing protein [Chloroflexi bacterium]|nr:VCBS repeat-containing protein [Chloroflexota bacterium]